MDNFFSTLKLFEDLERHKINSCGTVQPNKKEVLRDFRPKELKLKRGNRRVRMRGGLTASVWKNRREVYMLTNMDPPPAEGNICGNSNHPVQPHIMELYDRHMGYIQNSDRMANSYSMSQHSFGWTKKLFSHLLDLTLLNSWILLSSCVDKYTHWDFSLLLVRNFIEDAGKSQDCPTSQLAGRPKAAATKVL